MTEPHFTEPTLPYWQELLDGPGGHLDPPFRLGYPVQLPDGRWLRLPIRQRLEPDRAVASFIANHASFPVVDALTGHMAEQVRHLAPDVIVGLPTLGLTVAAPLARLLGHDRLVPLGTSRKYWYDGALSSQAASITTTVARPLYLDPNLVPLVAGRRVLLVDDTISTGGTVVAGLGLLERCGADVVGLAFAMSQSDRWRAALGERSRLVTAVFSTPLFARVERGWVPIETGAGAG